MVVDFSKIKSLPWIMYLREFKHYWIALLIFLLGMLISLAAFHFYEKQEAKRAQLEFNRLADIRIFLIKDEIKEILEQVDSVKSFFNASSHVSKDHFNVFTNYALNLHPDIVFLGWYSFDSEESVSESDKPKLKFFSLEHDYGDSQYRFFALDYLRLSNANKPFYIDRKDYPQFDGLFRHTQKTSTITVSNEIDFFQDGFKKGFFILNPVLENLERIEKTSESKRNALRGIIISFANFEKLVQKSRRILQPLGFNIFIYERSGHQDKLLFRNSSIYHQNFTDELVEDTNPGGSWSQSHSFHVGDKIWIIKISPNKSFFQNQKESTPWDVLILGTFFSTLASLYFLFLVNRNLTIEQIVAARTNELAESNLLLEKEIRERQKVEESMSKKQNYLHLRHEALKYFTKFTNSELQQLINEVILRTTLVMDIDRASIWFYDTKNIVPRLRCAGLYSLTTNSFKDHLEFLKPYYPCYFHALNENSHLILLNSINSELSQELSSYLESFHIISKLDIPIVFEGKLLGVLACEETRMFREWQLEDIHFGQTVADIIAIMVEQTARREAEKALQESKKKLTKAMKEAQAANEAKSEFLATISHELRTPLNAMIGFNQILLMEIEGSINESQRLSLKKIEKSSLHLLALINDILDLAKIEANKMELEIQSYNIADLIASCIEEFSPLAEKKGIKLCLSLDKPEIYLEMDKMRIRQVILNLLSN